MAFVHVEAIQNDEKPPELKLDFSLCYFPADVYTTLYTENDVDYKEVMSIVTKVSPAPRYLREQ